MGLILGPMLFNIFPSILADGTESTNFADDTSPGGEMNKSEGALTLQTALERAGRVGEGEHHEV